MNPAESYIINQPELFREILLYLQLVVERTIPELELKYKYKIPFYYLNGKPFCYFNASHKKQYVDVGLVKGKLIKVHTEYLVGEKRKKMVSLRYKNMEEVDNQVLIEVLEEAKSLY
ncbi:MAG: 2-dehydro-3-deoxyphosphooctonate aldolase [Kordia sp.]|nr:MAG: 2-dehydro-3-deoxyphosphooctonate aldolase [Kordia sp.]